MKMLHTHSLYKILVLIYGFASLVYSNDVAPKIIEILDNVKHVVVIDAGSTGSRVFLYNISANLNSNEPVKSNEKLYKYDIKVTPHVPFSSYKINLSILKLLKEANFTVDGRSQVNLSNYSNIYYHFTQILEVVNTHIHEKYRRFTPIFFMATSGMRFLHEDETVHQVNKLKLLFIEIFKEYPFHEDINVSVLSGIDEAIYSFLSLQELLYIQNNRHDKGVVVENALFKSIDNRFNHILQNNTCHSYKYATLIEIGGGSLQFVTPVPQQLIRGDLANKHFYEKSKLNNDALPISRFIFHDDFYKLDYDSNEVHLYSKSFLGLGRHVALEHYLRMVYTNRTGAEAACLPVGLSVLVPEPGLRQLTVHLDEIMTEKFDMNYRVKPFVIGTGEAEKCAAEIDVLLDGLVKTKVPFVVPDYSSIIGLENAFYVLMNLKRDGEFNYLEYTSAEILQDLGRKFCSSNVDGLKPFFNDNVAIEKLQSFCFNVNFIAKILTNVLSLDANRKVYPMNTILNNEITWTLSVNMFNVSNFVQNVLIQE